MLVHVVASQFEGEDARKGVAGVWNCRAWYPMEPYLSCLNCLSRSSCSRFSQTTFDRDINQIHPNNAGLKQMLERSADPRGRNKIRKCRALPDRPDVFRSFTPSREDAFHIKDIYFPRLASTWSSNASGSVKKRRVTQREVPQHEESVACLF